MTFIEFEQLSSFEKGVALKEQGVLLGVMRNNSGCFHLWAVNDFYVELLFESSGAQGDSFIVRRIFNSTGYLDHYLAEIDLGWVYAILNSVDK
jgi:hypothetical protein